MNEHDHTDKDELATKPAHDEVAKKAYAIYLKEGRLQGQAEQHWLESEAQSQPVSSDHPPQQPEGNAWHSQSAEEVLGHVGSNATGLPAAVAARRLAADGPNELKEDAPIRSSYCPNFWTPLFFTVRQPAYRARKEIAMLKTAPALRHFPIACALGLIALIAFEWTGLTPNAHAIPAFARKYGYECSVCHVPSFPKLNDFGNVFRDHGYHVGIDQDRPTSSGITMGYWPLSMHTTVGYQTASLRADGSGMTSGGLGFSGLDIQAIGLLAQNLSFNVMFTPGLSSGGFGLGGGDSDLEQAWLRVNNLQRFVGLARDSYLVNLKVGKMELDVPFSEMRSPTLNTNIVMYHYQAGTPWSTVLSGLATRSYRNPNDFMLGENQPSAELAGIQPTPGEGYFRYALTAISNSNLNTSNVGGGRGTNFYGHLTQSFGGYGIVTGHRIGVFGLYGTSPTLVNPACPSCQGVAGSGQPFSRVGADVSFTFDNQWNLFGAWMHANDSKNLFVSQSTIANPQNGSWNGAFVELDWSPTLLPVFRVPGWMLIYRYDLIRNDRQGDPSVAKHFNDIDSHTWMARYNFQFSRVTGAALHAEYNTFRAKGVGTGGGDQLGQTFLLGLDFAL